MLKFKNILWIYSEYGEVSEYTLHKVLAYSEYTEVYWIYWKYFYDTIILWMFYQATSQVFPFKLHDTW